MQFNVIKNDGTMTQGESRLVVSLPTAREQTIFLSDPENIEAVAAEYPKGEYKGQLNFEEGGVIVIKK